jgi:hypothetical protein
VPPKQAMNLTSLAVACRDGKMPPRAPERESGSRTSAQLVRGVRRTRGLDCDCLQLFFRPWDSVL